MSTYSFTTAPIWTYTDTGASVDQGTCFFYSRDGNWIYLITNWHVLTGRSPFDPKKSRTGGIPVQARMKLHKNVGGNSIRLSQKIDLCIPLNSTDGEQPTWLEHPEYKYRVDIAVLRIANDGNLTKDAFFTILSEEKDLVPEYGAEPMGDAFVLGYPWGLSSGDGVLPLYKRGSVASDPRVNYGSLPRFLIDCRTAAGMSGAPVLVSRSGIWAPSGTLDDSSVIGTVTNFAGVYSGRLEAQHSNAESYDAITELGIVWKKDALDEIVRAGVSGTKISDILAS